MTRFRNEFRDPSPWTADPGTQAPRTPQEENKSKEKARLRNPEGPAGHKPRKSVTHVLGPKCSPMSLAAQVAGAGGRKPEPKETTARQSVGVVRPDDGTSSRILCSPPSRLFWA